MPVDTYTCIMLCLISLFLAFAQGSPQTGLHSFILDDVQCCNGAFEVHQSFSIPNDTQIIHQNVPCCYGSGFVGVSISGSMNGSNTITYICNGSSAHFTDPITYNPDIETVCGINQYMMDNSLPLDLNITLPDAQLSMTYSNGSLSQQCECPIQYPEFIVNETFQCTDNPAAVLCSVPSEITGYIDVNMYISDRNDPANSTCGCGFAIEYLEWSMESEIVTVNYTTWQYIPWTVNDWNTYTEDYVKQCIEVQVKRCNHIDQCVWPTSDSLVDSATTHFDMGSYNKSTDCYCYAMMDSCVLPTTTEMITTVVSTNDETALRETTADTTTVDVSSHSMALSHRFWMIFALISVCLYIL
eukprot:455351_1